MFNSLGSTSGNPTIPLPNSFFLQFVAEEKEVLLRQLNIYFLFTFHLKIPLIFTADWILVESIPQVFLLIYIKWRNFFEGEMLCFFY